MVDVYKSFQYGEDVEGVPPAMQKILDQRLSNLGRVAQRARQVNIPVIYVMNSSPKNGAQTSVFGRLVREGWHENINQLFREGGVDQREFHGDRPGPLEIARGCEPAAPDYYLRKQFYSGFYETRLDSVLRNHSIKTILVGGIWLNVCVQSTLYDALYRNYQAVLIRDGTLAGEPAGQESKLKNTEFFTTWTETFIGPSTTVKDCIKALRD